MLLCCVSSIRYYARNLCLNRMTDIDIQTLTNALLRPITQQLHLHRLRLGHRPSGIRSLYFPSVNLHPILRNLLNGKKLNS